MFKIKNVILDLDDTLCECGIFYDKKIEDFALYSERRTGISKEICKKIVRNIDRASGEAHIEFSKERFPQSFSAASATLDIIRGEPIDTNAQNTSYAIGHSVFDEKYPLFSWTVPALLYLGIKRGYELYVLTKGDRAVQQRKLEINNLLNYINPGNVFIGSVKNQSSILDILVNRQLNALETVMVGDSLRDDIKSANDAGVHSVWVNSKGGSPDPCVEHNGVLPSLGVITGLQEVDTYL